MADKYFFGRTSFNDGGRARFNVGGTGNKDAEAQGFNYVSNNKYLQNDFTGSTPLDFSNISSSGIMSQAPYIYPPVNQGGGDGGGGGDKDDDDDDDKNKNNAGLTGWDAVKAAGYFALNPIGFLAHRGISGLVNNIRDPYKSWHGGLNKATKDAIDKQNAAVDKEGLSEGPGKGNTGAASMGSGYNEGNFCFDPSTPIQMANGSEKKIKDIQLGDNTRGVPKTL